jgi:hypothetical protein
MGAQEFKKMNKHTQEHLATLKRIKAGKEYDVFRKRKARDGYQCYKAYMEMRIRERNDEN